MSHEFSDSVGEDDISAIQNGQLMNENGFCFHDSQAVYFELQSDRQAILKLQNDGLIAKIRFDNIDGIEINTHPVTDWIFDGYCYKLRDSNFLKFHVDGYTITCEHVILDGIYPDDGA